MPLRIETFRNDIGGSSIYKAVSHPLAVEPARALLAKLAAIGSTAIYDPDGIADAFGQFYSLDAINLREVFVQNVEHLTRNFRGLETRLVTELPRSLCKAVLIASFDEQRALSHIRHLLPHGAEIFSFTSLRLPTDMQT